MKDNRRKTAVVCLNCGKSFYPTYSSVGKYCSNSCQQEYQNKLKYKDYLRNQKDFIGREITYNWLKPFILREQNNVCAICSSSTHWCGKELHFVMDHINGDATDNQRANLRLICPNCDSQLDTYKSRNIGKSTRRYKPYSIK